MSDTKTEEFFEKYGLETKYMPIENLKIGDSYSIYGVITSYLEEENAVIVNYQIKLKLNSNKPSTSDLIKERLFDSAIFVCSFSNLDENIKVSQEERLKPTTSTKFPYEGVCSTVVLGKKQEALN